MTLKAQFTLSDMELYIASQIERSQKAVLKTFQFAGQMFVRNARINGNYEDHTGNLRSSIGYVILENGKQIEENFEEAGSGTDKATGVGKAMEVSEIIAESFPRGIVLICVAGMEYAAAVESKGREVVTGTSLEIETELNQLLSAL